MKGRIIFLLEEPSMQAFLEDWLPRVFPGWIKGQHFLCIPHEGKSDLDRSLGIKLKAWRLPDDRFVIVRDNDNTDCLALKAKLRKQCSAAGRPDTLIRLICQELESWYLGDLPALARALEIPKIDTEANRKRYQHPDDWHKPSEQVKRLAPRFQKTRDARIMAQHLAPGTNRSHSLKVFVEGVRRLADDMGYREDPIH